MALQRRQGLHPAMPAHRATGTHTLSVQRCTGDHERGSPVSWAAQLSLPAREIVPFPYKNNIQPLSRASPTLPQDKALPRSCLVPPGLVCFHIPHASTPPNLFPQSHTALLSLAHPTSITCAHHGMKSCHLGLFPSMGSSSLNKACCTSGAVVAGEL